MFFEYHIIVVAISDAIKKNSEILSEMVSKALRAYKWAYRTKTCYKAAITIEISMVIAALSFLKEDKGWTKNVFRMHGND